MISPELSALAEVVRQECGRAFADVGTVVLAEYRPDTEGWPGGHVFRFTMRPDDGGEVFSMLVSASDLEAREAAIPGRSAALHARDFKKAFAITPRPRP